MGQPLISQKLRRIGMHILLSLGFLALPILMSPDFLGGRPFWTVHGFQEEMAFYLLTLLYFYGHHYWILPKTYWKQGKWKYIAAISLCFAAIAVLPWLIFDFGHPFPDGGPRMHGGDMPPMLPNRPAFMLLRKLVLNFAVFAIVTVLSLNQQVRTRMREIEAEQTRSQLALLRAQINPHFLFNSLNAIYAMAIVKADQTPDAIVKLANLMRYVLKDAEQDRVSLEQEINYLQDYVALQRMRLGHTAQVKFEVEGPQRGLNIAPLLLISFVENAFKHGALDTDGTCIAIQLTSEHQTLKLNVKNRKAAVPQPEEQQIGIGIDNARHRLQMLYPGRHRLDVQERPDFYETELVIQL